jgi:hypothetical protein
MAKDLTDLENEQGKDITLLKAVLERAAEALEPFAAFTPNPNDSDETYCVANSFKTGDYRRANAVLCLIKELLK